MTDRILLEVTRLVLSLPLGNDATHRRLTRGDNVDSKDGIQSGYQRAVDYSLAGR